MSFSSEVKEELREQFSSSRHCQLAELSAIVCYSGRIKMLENKILLEIASDNSSLLEKYKKLVQKLYPTSVQEDLTLKILESVKMWDKENGNFKSMAVVDGLLLQQTCCKRAFIRGAFLSSGSISNPDKSYHFEIVCDSLGQAKQLQQVMNSFEVDAKIVVRKKSQVVYLKEGSHIVDILNVMEAHIALMNLENVRIMKEMRNSVNRQVNCETANISKTVNAAIRQLEAIAFIREVKGLDSIPDHLREVANLRLEYPDISLKELGTLLDPPVGKSGVNHRLRKISDLAESMGFEYGNR